MLIFIWEPLDAHGGRVVRENGGLGVEGAVCRFRWQGNMLIFQMKNHGVLVTKLNSLRAKHRNAKNAAGRNVYSVQGFGQSVQFVVCGYSGENPTKNFPVDIRHLLGIVYLRLDPGS